MRFVNDIIYDADVLIAGGGPAGATCAYYLARQGYKVIVIDFQTFPRDKVCGDFVGPVAIRELQEMGVDKMKAFKKTNIIKKAAVFLDGAPLLTKNIPVIDSLPDYGRVIPREILDNWILDAAIKAGVQVITPCRFNDFKVFENAVVSSCKINGKEKSFTTKLLVGADGSSSTVARILSGSKPDPADRIVAVRAYYEDINCVADQAELYFTSKSFPGYYWFFPTGATTANVGVGMVLENFPKKEVNLKELLLDLVESDPTLKQKIGNGKLKDKVVGWPLSTYNPDAAVTGERVVLTGDAAGLINSLNGEGIQYAMQSGRWAAGCIGNALLQNDCSAHALKQYDVLLKQKIGYDMSLSNMVIQFIRNRNLNPMWLKMLSIMSSKAKDDDAYADIAGGILAGLLPANEALGFSFISKTAMQTFSVLAGDAMAEMRKGPFAFARYGINTAGYAFWQTMNAVKQKEDYFNWIKGLLHQGINISGYAIKDIKSKVLPA